MASIFENQWLDYYYCEAIPNNIVMVRGKKKTSDKKKKHNKSLEIISDGSIFVVNEGQSAIAVEGGRVIGVYTRPGEYEFHSERSKSIFSGGGLQALSDDMEREFTGGKMVMHSIYYMNMKEMKDCYFSSMGSMPVHLYNEAAGIDIDASISVSGRYTIKVSDPELLYKSVIGNVTGEYYLSSLTSQIGSEIVTIISTTIARMTEEGCRPYEITLETEGLISGIIEQVRESAIGRRGLRLVSIGFNSLSIREASLSIMQSGEIGNALMGDGKALAAAMTGGGNPLLETGGNNPLLENGKTNPLLGEAKDNPFKTEAGNSLLGDINTSGAADFFFGDKK